MGAVTKGNSIFRSAILSVVQQYRVALKVVGLPTVIRGAFELLIIWLDPAESTGSFLAASLADMIFVSVIAVSWHRFVLLKEVPDSFIPRLHPGRNGRYAWTWLLIGLVLSFSALALGVLLYFLAIFLGGEEALYAVDAMFPMGASSGLMFLAGAPFLWGFLYLLFRWGLILPDIAAGDGGLRLRDAMARSAPLNRAIMICALWATAVNLVFFAIVMAIPIPYEGEVPDIWNRTYLLFFFSTQLYWTGSVLVGAAILTEIYRRTELEQ